MPENTSARLLVKIDRKDVAMFRFLLESHDNEAQFSALEKNPCLLKIIFARENRSNIDRILAEIGQTLPIQVLEWPD